MNEDNQFPTPSPTAENKDMTIFVIIVFFDIVGLILLCYVCNKRKLPNFFYRNQVINFDKYFINNKIDIEDEDLCSICLSNFDDKDVKILKCNHFFHNDCIIKWLQVKEICPNCKVNLKSTVYGTEV